MSLQPWSCHKAAGSTFIGCFEYPAYLPAKTLPKNGRIRQNKLTFLMICVQKVCVQLLNVQVLFSVYPEMVGFGFGQGLKELETGGVAGLRRGFPITENAGRGQRMPLIDGHYLFVIISLTGHFFPGKW